MDLTKKCEHLPCSCLALPFQDYCGPDCELAVLNEAHDHAPMQRCHCQHPDCGGEPEMPVEMQGLPMPSEALPA